MAVTIKNSQEISLMRESNRLLARVHEELSRMIEPGVPTVQIDREGERLIRSLGGVPNFLHYNGYPASVCVSVNEEVVHGIPSEDRILREGDIVSLDAGLIYKGYHSDAARTYGVGEISRQDRELIEAARDSFFEGIKNARAGRHLREIGAAIYKCAKERGFGVIRDLTGHGIGKEMHEDPDVPNFPTKRQGLLLVPGMTLAVEPMLSAGTEKVRWLTDGWTVVTADGSKAAHYENTILITEGEPEILSL